MAANVQDAIILFGDSLTQQSWSPGGLAQHLAGKKASRLILSTEIACPADYVRKLDVLNRGFSGYQTQWAIPVFEQVGSA